MKKKINSGNFCMAASVLMAMSPQAAEIYNKDSNKLDLYGKVNASTTSLLTMQDDGGWQLMFVWRRLQRQKLKSTIN